MLLKGFVYPPESLKRLSKGLQVQGLIRTWLIRTDTKALTRTYTVSLGKISYAPIGLVYLPDQGYFFGGFFFNSGSASIFRA